MGKKGVRGVLIVLALVILGVGVWLGPLVRDVLKSGILDKADARVYEGNNTENLKMMYAALMAYHNSEDHFPDSSGWVTAIENRIKTADLTEADAQKKLVRPDLRNKPGEYGYAMNDAASKKYKGDLKDPKMPLLFNSKATQKNANGDPNGAARTGQHLGGNLAISLDGTILRLP